MLDEIDFLAAPKASEEMERLLGECGLTGRSIEEIRRHVASSVARYEGMIAAELRKPSNSKMTWNDAIRKLDERRTPRLAREDADRSLKIRKLLGEGVRPIG
jgi:hypothetical protein